MLGPLKFSLRATIDHHGPSIHSRHYTASINCCKKKNSIATTIKITEFEIINSKNSPTAYVIFYELIKLWVLDSNKRVGVIPWHWHILSINNRLMNKRRTPWVERCVSSWWPLFPSINYVLIYNYLYVYILYTSSGYRTYIYIHRECRSALVKLHPITVFWSVFGECAVLVLNATCWFLWFHLLCLALW